MRRNCRGTLLFWKFGYDMLGASSGCRFADTRAISRFEPSRDARPATQAGHESIQSHMEVHMSSRSMIVAAALSLAVFGSSNALVRAQEAPAPADQSQPDSENARFKVAGVVNANAVQVRSGPGAGYYATMKLDKGANVTVVGTKFEWLKI